MCRLFFAMNAARWSLSCSIPITIIVLIIYSGALLQSNALPENITIGGLFDSQDRTLEIAFRYAVEKVNQQKWMLPNSKLLTRIENVDKGDSYMASQRVCSMLSNGIAAVFGPQTETTTSTVKAICDTLEIPHIETRWDYRIRREDYSLNVHPHPGKMSSILAEIVKKFDWWTSFSILYEDGDSLSRVQEILKLADKDVKIVIWQLPEDNDYRPTLREMKNAGQTRIVLDCSVDLLPSVLKQAQQVGMMTDRFEYFITNLDMRTIDYEDFKYSGTNITGIRLVDPSRKAVQVIISDWKYGEVKLDRKKITITEENLKTEAALMYDAVLLFATAISDLDKSNKIDIKQLSCDSTNSWAHGNSLINYMKLVQPSENLSFLTDQLKFDAEGFRTHFHLDVIKLTAQGFQEIGYWSLPSLNITWPLSREAQERAQRPFYNISTKIGPPYFMLRKSDEVLTGNNRYEGYVVDLMKEIAEIANFSYQFIRAPDDGYGSYNNETESWDGMVGDIIRGKAQIAVADLTITSEREQAVDFSTPFMNLGISLLFKAKTKQPPELFSFLNPFSLEVWIYMSAAYIGVSLVLFALARFSPYEWDNPYPCIQDPDTLENNFTLLNSLWFTIGTLMQQGSDIAPRAPSTRIVAAMWSFFTLIIISSYTANLAAFLVMEPDVSPIEFIEDLVTQKEIKYGALRGASTWKFFKNSNSSIFKQMFDYMEKNPDVYVKQDAGVQRVIKENYAFFMESTSVDFITSTECGLRKVLNKLGANLDSKGYGLAVKKNDPLRRTLTSAILKLQEEEKLQALWKKWWEEKSQARCDDAAAAATGSAKPLDLSNVGGVFVVLISGMGLACVIAIMEFMWNVRNSVKEGRGSLCSELINDLKFVVKCHGSTKPVRKASVETRESTSVGLPSRYSGFQN